MNGLAQANGGTSDPLSDRTVVPLETCLARALDGLTPVRAEWAETGAALGLVLVLQLHLFGMSDSILSDHWLWGRVWRYRIGRDLFRIGVQRLKG